jgi:hypothetical protein
MPIGPVEYIIIEFPGNRFNGQIVPALKELVEKELIQIIDLVFIKKDANGVVTSIELTGADDEYASFEELDGEVGGLLNESDIHEAASGLALNSSAALLVWENVWATRFAEAVRGSGGRVLINERIPHSAVEAAFAALQV